MKTKQRYELESREFAFQIQQWPGVWFPDYKPVTKWAKSRRYYINSGRWTPGPGFEARIKDGVVMVRWVG